MAVEHGQQQRQPHRIQAHAQPARRPAGGLVHQRLDLHQQRPRAFLGDEHAGTRHRVGMLRQKERRRVGDGLQSPVGHAEHAQLVHGPEAVLDGADQPVGGVAVALEVQHRVDHVLQNARPSQRPFLGHVANHHHRHTLLLGQPGELRGAVAHLRHAARGRLQVVAHHRLDGVDDHHGRLDLLDGLGDVGQRHLGQHRQRRAVNAQARAAQGHLCQRLFAAHVQHPLVLRHQCQRLQQQRGLANARVASDQHDRTGHHAAAQHAVELGQPGRQPRHRVHRHLRQQRDRRGLGQHARRRASATGILFGQTELFQRVPGLAGWALSQPLGRGVAAFTADELGLGRCHVQTTRRRTRGATAHISS